MCIRDSLPPWPRATRGGRAGPDRGLRDRRCAGLRIRLRRLRQVLTDAPVGPGHAGVPDRPEE
eukprot:13110786-Alexandrium_andersonii.AAC.1